MTGTTDDMTTVRGVGAAPSDRWATAGHWSVPGVSRTRVEAWAPTRERCVAETVAGAVESFADVSDSAPVHYHRMTVTADEDPDVLFGVLDEVLFDISAVGVVPVWVHVRAVPSGADLEVGGVETADLRPGGRAPRTIRSHRIRRDPGRDGWRASVVLTR